MRYVNNIEFKVYIHVYHIIIITVYVPNTGIDVFKDPCTYVLYNICLSSWLSCLSIVVQVLFQDKW
jgi:hypothetical protein